MQTEIVTSSGDGQQQTGSESTDFHRIQLTIEQLDQEWEQLSAKLMVRDLHGNPQVPETYSGTVCGLITIYLGAMLAVLCWVIQAAPTPLPIKIFLNNIYGFASLMIMFGFVYSLQYHAKALRYNRLFAAYRSKRAWLKARLESLER